MKSNVFRPQEINRVVGALLTDDDVRRATFYGSATFTIKATRMSRPDKRTKREAYTLTIGKPNFAERKFIKTCHAAGERFPLRRVQLQFWPKTR